MTDINASNDTTDKAAGRDRARPRNVRPEASQFPTISPGDERRNWIRLRTLVVLRWVAIVGQLLAVTIAQRIYELQLEIGLCYLAIGMSVFANLTAVWIYPENKRLTEMETFLFLLFDLIQLGFLLTLTGGLNNPFALLVLGPVTISATALSLGPTLILGAVAFTAVTFAGLFHLPLRSADGFVLQVPGLFMVGFWAAIVVGAIFISAYARRVTDELHTMSRALLATQMALSREQKLTDLGGVVAAAAHELGTPLATIKLVSSELMEELPEGDLHDDAALIRTQADRCRDILRSMGRAGKDDLHLRFAPFETVVREAASPHTDRGVAVDFLLSPSADAALEQPQIRRHPEIIHGVRNLVQNAVDFAHEKVRVELAWGSRWVSIRISDDGPGFSAQVIGRLGDPFTRARRRAQSSEPRPGYDGMGLGLFIAKTLLERTGAELAFNNGTQDDGFNGAQVTVSWPMDAVAQRGKEAATSALGPNEPIAP
ncbi:MAG: ActS/PrrB/RegB family redox-sensitive histidine kinase [Pseudomonadota bacterium]